MWHGSCRGPALLRAETRGAGVPSGADDRCSLVLSIHKSATSCHSLTAPVGSAATDPCPRLHCSAPGGTRRHRAVLCGKPDGTGRHRAQHGLTWTPLGGGGWHWAAPGGTRLHGAALGGTGRPWAHRTASGGTGRHWVVRNGTRSHFIAHHLAAQHFTA